MKSNDAELLANLILERSRASKVEQERVPDKRTLKADEEKFLRLRRLFDEKYSVSTPRELMRT